MTTIDAPADTDGTENAADGAMAAPTIDDAAHASSGDQLAADAETFPREVVEKLRKENGKHRQNATAANERADALAQRLHLELVRATGRLADPADLAFDAEHLDDPETLAAAIDGLL